MNKLIMYPHGGSNNHGCEAIVRSTLDIMHDAIPEMIQEKILFSTRIHEDTHVKLEESINILPEFEAISSKLSFNYLRGIIQRNLFGKKDFFDRHGYRNISNHSSENTLALSIGGDNYCYGRPGLIYYMNSLIREKGGKTILWGCSIEPSAMDEEMINDLKGYEFIFARETITYNALKEKGLKNARLCPDPAFMLEPEPFDLPEGFEKGNTIGINLSPMIMSYEKNKGAALENYKALLDYLINETNHQIALIPHVVWDHNDDRIPLKKLYDLYKDTGRVVYIAENNDLNCNQLKYAISQCNILIPARTHASIAAYSQCVPTLVVGYSVKARGIANDLFGTQDGYLIPVQDLKDKNDLVNIYKDFAKREDEIRAHLVKIMPEYKNKIKEKAKEIANLNV